MRHFVPEYKTLALTVSLVSQEMRSWLVGLMRGEVRSFLCVCVFTFSRSCSIRAQGIDSSVCAGSGQALQ